MVLKAVEILKWRAANWIARFDSAAVRMKIPDQRHGSQIQSSRCLRTVKVLHGIALREHVRTKLESGINQYGSVKPKSLVN